MHEAATTWALVVGIDEYDDPGLDRLKGAAADAAAAVGWLRKLGVPDGQILLHAAPCTASQPLLAGLGIPCRPAREGDIWGSLLDLEKQRGSRLFVFFSGHGLFEPETGRLFLTQEARDRFWKNLGMDDLATFLRQLQFPRTFLFLDGCQNYSYAETARQTITAGLPAGGYTARPHHLLAACYAAEQGEVAREVDGRGVFLRHLLAALDPFDPFPEAVVFDYATGARSLDLRAVMDHVAREVAGEVDRQTPNLDPAGPWPATQPIPIVQLPPVDTAEVQLLVEPPEAVPWVEQIALSSPDLPLGERVPSRGQRLALPVARRLPVAARADAICHLKRGAPWQPSPGTRSFDVAPGLEPIRFPFQPVPSPGAVPGRSRPPVRDDDIEFPRGSYAVGDEERVERSLGRETRREPGSDRRVPLAVPRAPEPGRQPALRLALPAGGAAALAGALAGEDLLWIGPPDELPPAPLWREPVHAARALASLARDPVVRVEPGPVRLRLDLPWGSWSQHVHAPLVGEVEVALPERVGLPPLRLTLRGELDRPPLTALLGVSGEAPEGRLRPGLHGGAGAALRRARATPGPGRAAWELQLPAPRRGERPAPPDHGLVELPMLPTAGGRTAVFPLLPGRLLGVDLSGELPRVEPLSAVPLPAWDLLIAGGRLDGIGHQAVEALLDLHKEEPLAAAAAGYAVYAAPGGFKVTLLNRVKKQAVDAAGAIPDFDLLDLALAARKHNLRSPRLQVANPEAWFRRHAAERLRPWAAAGGVPVLRWGVGIALQLLAWAGRDGAFERWRAALAEIAPRLSPLSAWTAWVD